MVGLGNSGLNAAILLNEIGAVVAATDSQDTPSTRNSLNILRQKNIEVETGAHTEGFVRGSDLVVVSPGVENSSQAIKWAERLGIPVISEMELGYNFCKGKIIAITGTNGKSTVTTLIGEILKDGGKDAVVCGNIGNSLCGEISRIKSDTFVVLEVSSFQLERIEKFKPHIAIILNITDDHLDRYSKFDEYFKEKLKVFQNQDKGDTLILNYDAENLRGFKDMARSRTLFYSRKGKADGSYIYGSKIICLSEGSKKEVCDVKEIALKGLHNIENVLVSSLVGILCGVGKDSIRRTIANFKGLPHRFETVSVVEGVEYVDDSKGTTVDSTRRALESCTKPVILIAGGKDKNSDYGAIRDMVHEKVKSVVLIGEASGRIKEALGPGVKTAKAKDMLDAVRIAASISVSGDMVLLSPMCSSFDMFSSYKERGDVFKKAVLMIKNNTKKVNVES